MSPLSESEINSIPLQMGKENSQKPAPSETQMLEQNAIYWGFLMRYKPGREMLHQLQRTADIYVSKHVLFSPEAKNTV